MILGMSEPEEMVESINEAQIMIIEYCTHALFAKGIKKSRSVFLMEVYIYQLHYYELIGQFLMRVCNG